MSLYAVILIFHSTVIMSRLNNDVLTLIIDKIHDTHTLFSLLTVNEHTFRCSCAVLYRDPGVQLHAIASGVKRAATLSFIKMVLRFSPANDSQTDLVRQIFNVKQADWSPMVDYLSLIRVMRWESLLDGCIHDAWTDHRNRTPGLSLPDYSYPDSVFFVKKGMTAAICHHQLGNIVEMEIPFSMIEYYINKASELSRLEKIYLCDMRFISATAAVSSVIRLVKAIQQHHGPDMLRDCRIGAKQYNLLSNDSIPLMAELFSLLPIPAKLKDLALESPRPMDRHLVELERLHIAPSDHGVWSHLLRHYAGLSPGRILQCCRKLLQLNLDQEVNIRDPGLLAWAAQEARDRAAGKQTPPAIPLRELQLWVKEENPGDTITVLRDALIGFAASLTHCQVRMSTSASNGSLADDGDGDNNRHVPDLVSSGLTELPKLIYLWFMTADFRQFDPRLLLICPRLMIVSLDLYTATTTGLRVQLWPRSSHPYLTYLRLKGIAPHAFDPDAFANMPCLETLHIEQIQVEPTPDLRLQMERWTWDWHLPNLMELFVRCTLKGWFSLKILRTCPKLEFLSVEAESKQMLEVAAVLDDPSQDTFENVNRVWITGSWDMTPTDLDHLVNHVFPNVNQTVLHHFDSCTASQIVEMTRHHPTLKDVELPNSRISLEEREELGLYEDNQDIRGHFYRIGQRDRLIWSGERRNAVDTT
ncbi:hypothetical protein BGZ73_001745 [Actinomortierella ambigua]|nr:hypothetical protein BGZ73_001745 [Actinomortierella ambigua]